MLIIGLIALIVTIACIATILIANRIMEKYMEEDPMLAELRKRLQPVFPEIDKVILLKGAKSYTINKKRIHLCLVDKDGKYYDINMLTYVTLHELAHVKCDEIGHTNKFHKIFDSLLKTASQHGVYDPKKPITKDYCTYND